MRGWWRELAGLVLPVDCAGCGRPRTELCERCRGLLGGAATVRRVRPSPEPRGLPAVFAVGRYGDEVRAVVLAHKERGALGLAGPLGSALAAAALRAASTAGALPPTAAGPPPVPAAGGARRPGAALPGAADPSAPHRPPGRPTRVRGSAAPGVGHGGVLLLVPVPSSRRAVAQRGHDATARMARAAARELRRRGVRARVAAVLRQRRPVADQSGLAGAARRANLSGALEVARSAVPLLAAGPVVVVDDLVTTGASLAAAAGAVRAAGGWVCGAAVVAAPHTP